MNRFVSHPKKLFSAIHFLFCILLFLLRIILSEYAPFLDTLYSCVLSLFGVLLAIESISIAVKTKRREGLSGSVLQAAFLGAGVFCLSAAVCCSLLCDVPKYAASVSGCILILIAAIFCSAVFSMLLMRKARLPQNCKTLLVLGCSVKASGISRELKRRLDCAANHFMHSGNKLTILLCGGDTAKIGCTEAERMKEYLLIKGIHPQNILCENTSTTTKENFINAKDMLDTPDLSTACFLTSDYHVLRSILCAKDAGMTIRGIGCKTPLHRVFPCCLRETIAWLSVLKVFFAISASLILLLSFLLTAV